MLRTRPLITAAAIQRRVGELARAISLDVERRPAPPGGVLLLPVLKGSIMFAADLMRRLTVPFALDFLGVQSYDKTRPSGRLRFTMRPKAPVTGKHVIVIEDIIDTGRTAAAILSHLEPERPAALTLCALLDKPARRETPVPLDYVGFTIDDVFVVGYGLDYDQQGRRLPGIYTVLLDEPG